MVTTTTSLALHFGDVMPDSPRRRHEDRTDGPQGRQEVMLDSPQGRHEDRADSPQGR
jgi:hypothetical protein